MKYILYLCVILLFVTFCQPQCQKVKNKFVEFEIVPDVVDVAPKKLLKIHFPNDIRATLGNSLTAEQAKNVINIDFYPDDNILYTLIMVSPDLPTKEHATARNYLHWMVVNIPETKIAAGEEKAKFVSPEPAAGSGPHRFVFFMFEQKERLNVAEVFVQPAERENFSVKNFAKKYKLQGPPYGNFFMMSS